MGERPVAARHEDGYSPFHADVTDLLNKGGPQTVVVRAYDDPADLAKPRGKQDWKARATLDLVPAHDGHLADGLDGGRTVLVPGGGAVVAERGAVGGLARSRAGRGAAGRPATSGPVAARRAAACGRDVRRHVGATVSKDSRRPTPASTTRNELLWSPESPTLLDAELQLVDAKGRVLDEAKSYTALRHVALLGDRFVLNGKPYRCGSCSTRGTGRRRG